MALRIFNLVIGSASMLYFLIYALYAGLTNTFTYVWFLLAMICFTCGFLSNNIIKMWKSCHVAIKITLVGVFSAVIILFIVVLSKLIAAGASEPDKGADYVIILGAQVRGDVPSYNLSTRLEKAYKYLKDNEETKVIVSGGQGPGENITEAQAMKTYLIDKGISEDRIIMEDKSVNTDENIEFSKKLIDDKNSSIVLVTNSFHVYRSVRIANKQGLNNVQGLGSKVKSYTVPNLYVRETVAVIKYYICGQI